MIVNYKELLFLEDLKKISFEKLIYFLKLFKVDIQNIVFKKCKSNISQDRFIEKVKVNIDKVYIYLNIIKPEYKNIDDLSFDKLIKFKINLHLSCSTLNKNILNKYDMPINSEFFIKKTISKLIPNNNVSFCFTDETVFIKNYNKKIILGSYNLGEIREKKISLIYVFIKFDNYDSPVNIPSSSNISNYLKNSLPLKNTKIVFYKSIENNGKLMFPITLGKSSLFTSKIRIFTIYL